MSKLEKRIESWRNSKQNVTKEEIEPILDKYFSGWIKKGGSSHEYKLHHKKLIDIPPYGPGGHLTIPVTGGQSIKYIYIKNLLKAIDIIKEND